ncbi:hypothetical protein J6590_087693 [Homalodisca vitripennis]|nr:hypothetical protein J6590_087693 [Homalodisca vitripennis]
MLISALDWQSLPERLYSRTPASTVLYRTGHSVMNYSFAVVLCVSESVKDIFRLHACLQDSSLFPTLTDHNLALNNSRLRLGTSYENKGHFRTTTNARAGKDRIAQRSPIQAVATLYPLHFAIGNICILS